MLPINNLHNFIATLPQEIREEIERESTWREFKDGEYIYRQGDPSNEVYELRRGNAKLCNYSHEGKEVVLFIFKPGDCFGDLGFYDQLPRLAHAVAVSSVHLRVIDGKNFGRLYKKHPALSKQININLSRRIRFLYHIAEDAATLSLQERLARTIRRMAYSHAIADHTGQLYLETSHEALGNLLGATRQSISKELRNLEQQNYIEMRYGKIFISDLEALNHTYANLMGPEELITR